MWDRLAEICAQYLGKGQQVAVEGKLQSRQWEDDLGRRHWKTEVVVSSIEMLSGRGKGAMHEWRDRPRPAGRCHVVTSQPAQTSSSTDTRRCVGVPTLRVIHGRPPEEQSQSPTVGRACRYRAATVRVAAGARVRHPACPRCGERLCYQETAAGALFLHADDPDFWLRLVDETG